MPLLNPLTPRELIRDRWRRPPHHEADTGWSGLGPSGCGPGGSQESGLPPIGRPATGLPRYAAPEQAEAETAHNEHPEMIGQGEAWLRGHPQVGL